MAGKPGQQGKKPRAIPEQFRVGWLERIDRRYAPAVMATAQLQALQDALGGEVSPQQQMLCERATWLHIRLQQLEQEYLAGHGLDTTEYASLVGAQVRVLSAIGLHRKARPVQGLHEYMKAKSRNTGGSSAT